MKTRNSAIPGLKIYGQGPVVGNGRLDEGRGCRGKNAAEILAMGADRRNAVVAGDGSIGYASQRAQDSYSVDMVGTDCAEACRASGQQNVGVCRHVYLTPDGLGMIDFRPTRLDSHEKESPIAGSRDRNCWGS